MKKLSFIVVGLFLVSCGGAEEDSKDNAENLNEQEVEVVANDSSSNEVLEEEQYIPENEDGNWQIDDYAEMFIGGEIAATAEESNMENAVGWFYQELDLAGGFASVTGAIEGWNEYVIWRMTDGDDLIGTMSVGCGPVCDYAFTFYKGKGKDASPIEMTEIMPMNEIEAHKKEMHEKVLNDDKYGGFDYPEDAQLYFRFPQKGTSMEVDLIVGADELQTTILELTWDKTKFSIKKKYTEIKVII
ncbi:MAG: hypothetical protein ABJG68_11890 [Crocinitomicaceae bacterium]